jgi:toxin ParE1/3/4
VRQVKLSPKACADLDSIWDFTAQRWGVPHAEEYLRALGETMKLLAASPRLGLKIDNIRQGYFKFPAASHIIFYRVSPNAMDVIRILHKSMDVEQHI